MIFDFENAVKITFFPRIYLIKLSILKYFLKLKKYLQNKFLKGFLFKNFFLV